MLSNIMKETEKNSTIVELCLEILAGYLDFVRMGLFFCQTWHSTVYSDTLLLFKLLLL